MPADYYLHLEDAKGGHIKGESPDKKFENEIQVLGFTFHVDHLDSGAGPRGAPIFHDVEIIVPAGGSSAAILQDLCDNVVIKKALISCRKVTGAGTPEVFLTWEFTTGRITSYKQYPGENGRLIDAFRLRFAKFVMESFRQKPGGSLESSSRQASHDMTSNK